MRLQQLDSLRTVARHGSFSKAAAHLNISQPSISAQIQELESELGTALVLRGPGKRTHLTEEGKVFVEHVEKAFQELEIGVRKLNKDHEVHGTVRISVLPSVMSTWLPEVLAHFLDKHPSVEVLLEEEGTAKIYSQLEGDNIDLGIVTHKVNTHYAEMKLFDEPFVAILPVEAALRHPHVRRLRDLEPLSFVLYKPGYFSREIVVDACVQSGFRPKVSFETGRITTIISLVKAGLGCSLIPQSSLTLCQNDRIVAVPLEDAPSRTTSVIWKRDHLLTKTEQELTAFLKSEVIRA